MNEKNILFGKMFLIFALLFTMPFAHAGIGDIVNSLKEGVGSLFDSSTPQGKIALTTGIVSASYFLGDKLQQFASGESPGAQAGAKWGNGLGNAGALIGGFFGPGVGAIVGGLTNFLTTFIGGLATIGKNDTLATLQRLISVRVKTLDVNSASIYEPKFKSQGDVSPSTKIDVDLMSDKNFVRKSNDKYVVYYPIAIDPNVDNIDAVEHFVLSFDVKGLPEYVGKTPIAKTLTDNADTTMQTVEAMTLGKESTRRLGWCKVEDKTRLAELDNNVSKEYVERDVEEAQVQGKDAFVLLFKNLSQEEQVINIPNYNCFGANGLRGATGLEYAPKVEYNWAYDTYWLEKCNSDNNYIYCDSLQFNMALINLFTESTLNDSLKSISQNTKSSLDFNATDTKSKIAYEELNFKAYLMKDGYTKDFFNDFVDYALNTTFLGFGKHAKAIITDLYSQNKIEFKPLSYSAMNNEGYKLEKAGLYNVTVAITYVDEIKEKQIYLNNSVNSNVEKITIYLELISEDNNPVYYMPLDATMGVKNGVIERIGYGVDYKGDAIWFKNETNNPMLLEPSLRSSSTPIVSLNMSVDSSIESLNGFNKGLLLQISPRASAVGVSYDVKRYMSYPAPVGLELNHTKAGDAFAFYTINIAGSPRTAGNSFIDWTLVCADGFDCKSFDGSSTLDEIGRSDIYGTNSKVPIGQFQSIAYGLYWDKDSIIRDTEKVRYVGLVYMPEEATGSMNIVTSSGDAKLFDSIKFRNGSQNLQLDSTYKSKISDLEDIYELVKTEKVCVGYTEGSYDIKFWWNPAVFLPETK